VNLSITYDFEGNRVGTHKNIGDFVSWLLHDDDYAGHTVIFHNGKGYDFQFIVQALVEGKVPISSKLAVKPVMNGSKIMTMSVSKRKSAAKDKSAIRFVDSLNFLVMPLKKFTKTFSLSTKKGFYPHFFNTNENVNYRRPIPSVEMFGRDSMDKKTQKEFDAWFADRQKGMSAVEILKYQGWLAANSIDPPDSLPVWDNGYELDSYCDADVRLLREGCLAFRNIILEATEGTHDPFSRATIASSAKAVFTSTCLKDNMIGAFTVGLNKKIKPASAGGRTGPTKLYYMCQEGEKIHYVDMTSLYPFINANGRYPIGHPDVTKPRWGECCDDAILALDNLAIIRCDVECPQDLLHPLLHNIDPITKRLMFDLRTKKNVSYTSLELQKAIEIGYHVTKVYEMLKWEDECRGIFNDYVRKFLQIKQQAAGWPEVDMTEGQKAEYLNEYFEHEGVRLDPSKIAENDGLYATAKFYLNSLWGKFGQRFAEELSQTSILFSGVAEDELAMNKAQCSGRMTDISIINEECVVMNSRPAPGSNDDKLCYQRNYSIGAFTTAQARLKLYEGLDRLGDRVLYYDTDSIIYVARAGEDPNQLLPLGKYLGDWTNEIDDDNKYGYGEVWITTFVSTGPKSYGYETNEGKTKIKIKGFSTRRQDVAKKLNFASMMGIMVGGDTSIKISGDAIRRPELFTVKTIPVSRTFRDCYMKRQRLPQTVPWMIDTIPWKVSTERELFKTIGKKFTHACEPESKTAPPAKRRRQLTKTIYSVYLLQSVSDPRVFYTGSSPDPEHCLRQHNGELDADGAEETILHRPWKLFAVLEGFEGRSAADGYEFAAKTCRPELVQKAQVTEPLRQLRRFLWPPTFNQNLTLAVADDTYEEPARLFKQLYTSLR